MIESKLKDVAAWCGGSLVAGVPASTVTTVSTDTRTIGEGDAFLALKGENFNGHDFVEKAIESGASTLIVSELPEATEGFTGNIIHVRDTQAALQSLALHYRRASLGDLTVVGITGSNGKTSTKDFLRAVLEQAGPVNATPGNLNNHIGLPLTVLRTGAEHRFGVWEMGMNHPGEIAPLAEIAAPEAAIITNIGWAHIEFMKTRQAIADEKGELARAVPDSGFCVMPAEDEYFDYIRGEIGAELLGVGGADSLIQSENEDNRTDGISFDLIVEEARARVALPVPGRHMVTNALLAAAVGHRLGIGIGAIAQALGGAAMSGGRLEVTDWNGVTLLNDTYNANPDSMKAALGSLAETAGEGRKIAVLGFMGELGDHEERSHREVGAFAAEQGIDLLVTVSDKAKRIAEGAGEKIDTEIFERHEEAATFLKSQIQPGDSVLFKGSRGARMETVIELLIA